MPIKVYGIVLSPVVRSTLLTIEALGLEVEFQEVNTLQGDQLKPEFLEINPQHTVPTIQDGDYVLWDSHAINSYLVDKYGKDDSLYPKDLQQRGVVNQRLYFDCGVLFPRVVAILVSIVRENAKNVRKDLADPMIQAYTSLEKLLEKSAYVAGDQVTIADFSILATLSTADLVVPITPNEFPRISEWLSKMKNLSYYEKGNGVGLSQCADLVTNKLEENA